MLGNFMFLIFFSLNRFYVASVTKGNIDSLVYIVVKNWFRGKFLLLE